MKIILLCLYVLPLLAAWAPLSSEETPQYLYKVVSPQQWQESQAQGTLIITGIDKEFIHLATEEQVPHVAQKFWKNQDYVILKLIPSKLQGRLVFEVNPGGTTKYYHLYEGKIPLDAVVDSKLFKKDTQESL